MSQTPNLSSSVLDGLMGVQDHLDIPEPEYRWLLDGIWQGGATILLGGPSGTGKSILCQQMALDMARGECLFGNPEWRFTKPYRTLYFDQENGPWLNKDRMLARFEEERRPPPPKDQFAIFNQRFDVAVDTPKGYRWLLDVCKAYRPEVVFLDAISDMMEGDENVQHDVKKVFHNLWKIGQEVGHDPDKMPMNWVVVHHSSKTSRDKPTNSDYDDRGLGILSGSRRWEMSCNGGIVFWKDEKEEERKRVHGKRPGEFFRVDMYWGKTRAADKPVNEKLVVHSGYLVKVHNRPPGLAGF